MAVVGGGDSALDAALMVLGRHGLVDLIVREAVPIGKPDSLARIRDAGGVIRTSTEVRAGGSPANEIGCLTDGQRSIARPSSCRSGFCRRRTRSSGSA